MEERPDGLEAPNEYRKRVRAVLTRIEEALVAFVLTLQVRINEVRVAIKEVNCAAAKEGISGFENVLRAPLPPQIQRLWHLANFIKHSAEWNDDEISKREATTLCELGAARIHYDEHGGSLVLEDWPVLIGVCGLAGESPDNPDVVRAVHTVLKMCSDWSKAVETDIQSRAGLAAERIQEIRQGRQRQSRLWVSGGEGRG